MNKVCLICGATILCISVIFASFIYVIKNEREKTRLQLTEQANKITIETQKTTQKKQQSIVKNLIKQNKKKQEINQKTNENTNKSFDNASLSQLKKELQNELKGFNVFVK